MPKSTGEDRARLRQFLRCIDAEWNAFNQGDVDAHPCVERAQLLELLALLVGGRRQLDETLQRRAPVGVEPDVVIVRPRTGCIGAGKCDGAISAAGSDSGPSALAISAVSMVGRSPCTLTTIRKRCSGSSACSAS